MLKSGQNPGKFENNTHPCLISPWFVFFSQLSCDFADHMAGSERTIHEIPRSAHGKNPKCSHALNPLKLNPAECEKLKAYAKKTSDVRLARRHRGCRSLSKELLCCVSALPDAGEILQAWSVVMA